MVFIPGVLPRFGGSPGAAIGPLCPTMAALCGTGLSRGGTGGRSSLERWRRIGMREWMFRVRNWTGEEINSGTRRKKRECYPPLHWDVACVFYANKRGLFKAAGVDVRRGTKWRRKKKTGACKVTKVRQRRTESNSHVRRDLTNASSVTLFTAGVSVFTRVWVSLRSCLTVNLVQDCPAVSNLLHPPPPLLLPAVCLSHGYEIYSHLPRDVSLYTPVAVQPSCWDDR